MTDDTEPSQADRLNFDFKIAYDMKICTLVTLFYAKYTKNRFPIFWFPKTGCLLSDISRDHITLRMTLAR